MPVVKPSYEESLNHGWVVPYTRVTQTDERSETVGGETTV
jgi:hypothetical protein